MPGRTSVGLSLAFVWIGFRLPDKLLGYNYPMQYRLRTLLIVLALGPVVLAGTWWIGRAIVEFAPRPRSSAEAFTGFRICGLLLFALGGVVVERYRRQSQMRKAG